MGNKNSLSAFTFFYRYLFSKRANSVVRRVSFICFLGLVISIGSLLIVFNVMGGLGQAIKERFLATEPHIIISLRKSSNEENAHFTDEFVQRQKHKIEKILQSDGLDSGVISLYFFESVDMVIRTPKGVFSGAVARGYDSAWLESFLHKIRGELILSAEGDILDDISVKGKKEEKHEQNSLKNNSLHLKKIQLGNEELFFVKEKKVEGENEKSKDKQKKIVMGLGLASELDLYEEEKVHLIPAENLLLPPGEPIQFEFARVDSIISTQNAIWNSNYIFYDRKVFPSFRESSSYGAGFEISLIEPEDFLVYKTVLEKEGLSVETWPERNSSVFLALKVEKIIMSIFLSLAGLITLLAVSSLLALLIVQKKKEIGALMAMGLPIQKVQSLFVKIGLLLCSCGILGAWLFSLLICLFLKYSNIPILSQFHAGVQFPVKFNFMFMFGLFACIFFLAYLSCVLSVRSQSCYSPSELLKTVNG